MLLPSSIIIIIIIITTATVEEDIDQGESPMKMEWSLNLPSGLSRSPSPPGRAVKVRA